MDAVKSNEEATKSCSDADLLRKFTIDGDHAAFAEIIARHGTAVLGVCRRAMGNGHDADDAFQAVFLSLATNAAKWSHVRSLGGWLCSVAYRTCQKAKVMAARRRKHEQRAAQGKDELIVQSDSASENPLSVYDELLADLPERIREVVVLCDVEGRSNQEAAAALACPVGTVQSRLSRGRELLRKRLGEKGVSVTTAALVGVLATLASPAVPTALAAKTVAAIQTTLNGGAPSAAVEELVRANESAVQTGWPTWAWATPLAICGLAALCLAAGRGGWARQPVNAGVGNRAPTAGGRGDVLEGVWAPILPELADRTLVVRGNTYERRWGARRERVGTFTQFAASAPPTIVFRWQVGEMTSLEIAKYELKDDELTLWGGRFADGSLTKLDDKSPLAAPVVHRRIGP